MTTVDRTHRIADERFSDANPERITVTRNDAPWADPDYPWTVWRGDEALGDFPTHAEAITWAQRAARQPSPEQSTYVPLQPQTHSFQRVLHAAAATLRHTLPAPTETP